jgi:hypothetical protein
MILHDWYMFDNKRSSGFNPSSMKDLNANVIQQQKPQLIVMLYRFLSNGFKCKVTTDAGAVNNG